MCPFVGLLFFRWLQILMSFTKLPDRRATDAMNLLTSLILEEK